MNAHLNESQLDALLESPASENSKARQHLLECTACRSEFHTLQSSLANFRQAANNVSAVYTPKRLLETNLRRPAFFTVPRTAWGAGLVAAMALCTVSVSVLHKPVAPAHPTVQTASEAQADDALLNDIDQDLSTSVPPSLQPLDIVAASEKTTTTSSN